MRNFQYQLYKLKCIIFIAFLIFISCDNRLHVVTVKNNNIQVTKYSISAITTMHDFIEVKKNNSVVEIMKADAWGFADIIIKHDTIIIEYLPTIIYKIADEVFDYKIKLDTTISINYWRQKVEEREKLKK